ncbi:hypothetical protein M378DRAFT_14969 [Amanita muscaria Koide BX008]|uniref:Uncharacterized protein n=1 Tax=Amanita muscaria (strain Koide BX008) TaxID=946122 RepID=A0A0C2WCY1_AMAMK|nr:hypothetical protein M378DRAFT_14969 [Amanita muscaria Koide BX008]
MSLVRAFVFGSSPPNASMKAALNTAHVGHVPPSLVYSSNLTRFQKSAFPDILIRQKKTWVRSSGIPRRTPGCVKYVSHSVIQERALVFSPVKASGAGKMNLEGLFAAAAIVSGSSGGFPGGVGDLRGGGVSLLGSGDCCLDDVLDFSGDSVFLDLCLWI